MSACPPRALDFALWALIVLAWAGLALLIGVWRAQRGQLQIPFASRVRLEPHRLHYWRHDAMTRYAYADLDDRPYAPPTVNKPEIEKGRSEVSQLEARNPELSAKLKNVARMLVGKMGAITSADVWEALDPATREQAKKVARGKIMAVAFNGKDWEKTGRYLPKGSHGRPVSEWRLRQAAAA